MTTRPDLPAIPPEHPAWRLLHSHYHDLIAERPHLADTLDRQVGRSFDGFMGAIAGRVLQVRWIVHDRDALSFVLCRTVNGRTAPLGPSIPAAALALEADLVAAVASMAAERWPDDLSGLDDPDL
jgi:hypothetical protein